MKQLLHRREFLKRTAVFTAGIASLGPRSIKAANRSSNTVRIAIIGCNGRGMNHITGYAAVSNVEIACICDVDAHVMAKGIAEVSKKQERKPRGEQDLRRVLEDPELDAVSIATPDHWHTPATILACAAGKHVYVEKPGSHNLLESEWIVEAARKHKRLVQMGNQRRSWPWVQEAMSALRAGELGRLYHARGWYTNHRASIGHGKTVAPPDWLNYSLWQGPAPEQPYRDNVLHYNWHWFWNWGTGEIGNNGVHALDLARWGLDVELPRKVTCGGGRYAFQDDWETPDTMAATFDFGDKGVIWEGQSCAPRGFENSSFGVTFYGEKGCLAVAGPSARIYDLKDKLVREISVNQKELFQYDSLHFANFIEGIRNGELLRAEIGEGQKSTMLCHLANIAWRSGHTLQFDPVKRQIVGDRKASALGERQYRRGWEPRI